MTYLQHARRHAPGGTDPIVQIDGWGYDRGITAAVDPGTIATKTFVDVDFTSATIHTNDSGYEATTTASSPFTGDHYSLNWGTTATKIHINVQGVYIVRRMFVVNTFPSDPTIPYSIGIKRTGTTPTAVNDSWFNAGVQGKFVTVLPPTLAQPSALPIIEWDERWIVESPGSMTVGMQVYQDSGLSTSTQIAAITIIRTGDANHP